MINEMKEMKKLMAYLNAEMKKCLKESSSA